MKFRVIMSLAVLLVGILLIAQQCPNNAGRPVASFSVDQASGQSPLTVNFDASSSYDPDGTIVTYTWNFGNGLSGTGVTTSHTFVSSTDRTYSVRLTITDNDGKTDSTSGPISVTGTPNGTTLFFDDFEDEDDDPWVSTTDQWRTDDGEFVFYEGQLMPDTGYSYVLAGKNWSSYKVEADVWLDGGSRAVGFVLYAQQNLSSMVIAWGSLDKIWWQVLANGETIYESDPVEPGLFADRVQHIQIAPSGNHYRFVVDGLERSTFENTYYTTGMPGLAGWNGTAVLWPYPFAVDNFRVTALP